MLDEAIKEGIFSLVKKVWENPELSGEEVFACAEQIKFLKENHFTVISPVAGEKTAYKAEFIVKGKEEKGYTFAFCAEYDALPDVKHGCGHHLIMGSALVAAFSLKELLEKNNITGKVVVLGCPAEETYGGKSKIAESNITEGIDAFLMAHPTGGYSALGDIAYSGLKGVKVIYHGTGGSPVARMANPAFHNPLDAQTLLYQAVAMRRHFFPRDVTIVGVISDGGSRANMLPVTSESNYTVRSQDPAHLEEYTQMLEKMAQGAALMTGTEVEIKVSKGLPPTRPNMVFNTSFLDNMEKKGYRVSRAKPVRGGCFAVTDFSTLSQKKPGCHLHFPIMENASAHTEKFYLLSGQEKAYQSMLDTGISMAETAFMFMSDEKKRSSVREAFCQLFFEE